MGEQQPESSSKGESSTSPKSVGSHVQPPGDGRLRPNGRQSHIYTPLKLSEYVGPMMTQAQVDEMTAAGELDLDPSSIYPMYQRPERGNSDGSFYQVAEGALELRILNLKPAPSLLQDVECTLEVTSLKEAPVYEALSYTWGDPSHQRFLSLNGERFAVTYNLWSALRYLRHPTEVRRLWVDALCINQSDVKERNFMVIRMYNIYHNASTVVTWLGEATPQSEKAIQLINEDLEGNAESYETLDPVDSEREEALRRKISDAGYELWEALLDFYGRPWWTRVWVMQEVSASRNWTIICGKSQLDGNKLADTTRRILSIAWSAEELPEESKKILMDVPGVMAKMSLLYSSHFGLLVELYRDRQATDARDKVYAFLNMVIPRIMELKPNYDLPIEEVYYQATVQIIKGMENLEILRTCELHDKAALEELTSIDGVARKYVPNMPSWVPNWATRRLATPLWGAPGSGIDRQKFSASGNAKARFQFHGNSIAESRGVLTIQGLRIDNVADVGADCYGKYQQMFINDALELLKGKRVTISPGEDNQTAFLRTLTLDNDWQGQRLYAQIAENPDEVSRSIGRAIVGRVFFRTDCGFIGLGPRGLRKGDAITIIPGCRAPIALRKGHFIDKTEYMCCEKHDQVEVCKSLGCSKSAVYIAERFEVLGESYMHGVMHGELVDLIGEGWETLNLSGQAGKVQGIKDPKGADISEEELRTNPAYKPPAK